MKYIIVLGDGMADEPIEALDGKTPVLKMFAAGKGNSNHQQEGNKAKENETKVFLSTYILPIIAFFAGKVQQKQS